MKEQLLVALISTVPTIVASIVGFLLGRANKKLDKKDEAIAKRDEALKQKEDDMKHLKNGVCALLRVQLIEYHDKYIAEGKIPHYVHENYESMYKAYHELGGNGTITAMYEKVKQLEQY